MNNIKDLPLTACDGTPGIESNGEVLTRLSPGVGHDSTAQGDKVSYQAFSHKLVTELHRSIFNFNNLKGTRPYWAFNEAQYNSIIVFKFKDNSLLDSCVETK